MAGKKDHFTRLFQDWMEGKTDEVREREFITYLSGLQDKGELYDLMKEDWVKTKALEEPSKEIKMKILAEILNANTSAPTIAHRIHFLKTAWFRYAAAIILIAGLGTAAYLWNTDKKADQTLANGNKQLQTDIPPGGEKAVLTLADGSKIVLDNAANGSLAQQGNAQVIKLADGQIAYNLKGLAEGEVMMNTMSTPNGGQYQLTLPDGTKVWLNAASSITYPAVFVGKTRSVKIEGEVYFEVAKNRQKPFIVDIDGKSSVEVLGTSFNINAYKNEAEIKTTLAEGSIKVIQANQSAVLKPGQQAVVEPFGMQPDATNIISVVANADIEKALAWKNGWFNFNDENLYNVMRQLERWYDINVKYEGNIPEVIFQGKMDKGVTLSGMLNIFSSFNFKINARLEGRTLIVSGTQ